MSTKKTDNIEIDDLITLAEAARLRGVTRQAIGKLVKNEKLKLVEIGGQPFLSRKEVADFKPGKSGRPKKGENG